MIRPAAVLTFGSMVAVLLSNYRKFQIIGSIIGMTDEEVYVDYWKGSYLKEWIPHLLQKKVSRKNTLDQLVAKEIDRTE